MPWYINDSGKKHYEVPDSISRNDDDAVLEYLKKARSVGDEFFENNEAATKASIGELQNKDQPFTNVAHGANAVAGAAINTLAKPVWDYLSKDVPSYLEVLNKFQKGEMDGAAAEEAITGLMTGVAGTSMVSNRPAAESAIGMFIGPKGRARLFGPNYNEAKNQERINKGMTKFEDPNEAKDWLWTTHGIEQFADKGIRSELSDYGSVINQDVQDYLNGLRQQSGSAVVRSVDKLGNVLKEHPDLFKAYPSLKDVRIKFQYGAPQGKVSGTYDFDFDTIELNGGNFEDLRSILLHEIQHRIQFEEGWALGNNSKNLKVRLTEKIDDEFSTIKKYLDEMEKKDPEAPEKNPIYKTLEKQASKLHGYKTTLGLSMEDDYALYKRYFGEAESRNVQLRDKISKTDSEFQERVRPGKSMEAESVPPKRAIYQLHGDGPVDFKVKP